MTTPDENHLHSIDFIREWLRKTFVGEHGRFSPFSPENNGFYTLVMPNRSAEFRHRPGVGGIGNVPMDDTTLPLKDRICHSIMFDVKWLIDDWPMTSRPARATLIISISLKIRGRACAQGGLRLRHSRKRRTKYRRLVAESLPNRSADDNLDLRRDESGDFPDGARTLRQDRHDRPDCGGASGLYRISPRREHHHLETIVHQPMYDFAHTWRLHRGHPHSVCTLEFRSPSAALECFCSSSSQLRCRTNTSSAPEPHDTVMTSASSSSS